MKRFLLFAHANYYPNGAARDYIGDFDDIDEALASVRPEDEAPKPVEHANILDTATDHWLKYSWEPEGWVSDEVLEALIETFRA